MCSNVRRTDVKTAASDFTAGRGANLPETIYANHTRTLIQNSV